jgi:hypothetical protein
MNRKPEPVATTPRHDQMQPRPLHVEHARQFAHAIQTQNSQLTALDRRTDPNRAPSCHHTASLRDR